MKHLLLVIILFSISACVTTNNSATMPVKNPDSKQTEPSLNQRIYYFQHKLLPKWTFETNGAFFKDIMAGNIEKLKTTAAKLISTEYADSIAVKSISKYNGTLIVFQKPSSMADCYFVFIREVDSNFIYVTYEKTMDFTNEGFIGVVGSWATDGSHHNHGPRKYNDPDSFILDAVQIK